jgi:DNA-directed RNA polymerase subunit D
MKVISRKGENFRFLLEGTNAAFANTLRRIMIAEIPNMTIDATEFHDNTSALFDEIIAHRLGMLPLTFDPDKFNLQNECKCEGKGCPSCQVFFALDKTGPLMVYSSDLKSSNKAVKPTSPDFPIVKLLKAQRLKLEATARLGTGREHAKFQAANVSYSNLPALEAASSEDAKKITSACPKGIIETKNRKLVITEPFLCDECKMCEDASGGEAKVIGDATKFVFKVESISGLGPEYIVGKAVQILEEKAKEFREQLKEV